jgi:1-deoxy-D-xylulose-5-phosphate synthase
VLRFCRGETPHSMPPIRRIGPVDVLAEAGSGKDLLLAAARLAAQGVEVTVIDPRWVVPVPVEVVALANEHRCVVTLEDSSRYGGFGWALAAALRDAAIVMPLLDLAVPLRFHTHGTRSDVLVKIGLTTQDVSRRITEWITWLPASAHTSPARTQ